MAIVPRKKISKTDKRVRHSARQTINIKRLTSKYVLGLCKNCNKAKLSYRVCPHCWFYAGKQILTIKTKKDKTTTIEA